MEKTDAGEKGRKNIIKGLNQGILLNLSNNLNRIVTLRMCHEIKSEFKLYMFFSKEIVRTH